MEHHAQVPKAVSIPNDDVTMPYVLVRKSTTLPATCFSKLGKGSGRPP